MLIAAIRRYAGAQKRGLSGSMSERLRAPPRLKTQARAAKRDCLTRLTSRVGRERCEDLVVTETPSKIPALQITHTVDEVWHVAAKWSDGHVENIAAFESEVEANEWISSDFQEWLERRKKG
jgi:hypothetical protein